MGRVEGAMATAMDIITTDITTMDIITMDIRVTDIIAMEGVGGAGGGDLRKEVGVGVEIIFLPNRSIYTMWRPSRIEVHELLDPRALRRPLRCCQVV